MNMYPTANLNWDDTVDMLDLAEFADYCDKTNTLVFYDISAKSLRTVKLRFPNTD